MDTASKYKSFGESKEIEFAEEYINVGESVLRERSTPKMRNGKKSKKMSIQQVKESAGSFDKEQETEIELTTKLTDWEKNSKLASKHRQAKLNQIMKEANDKIVNVFSYKNIDEMVVDIEKMGNDNYDLYRYLSIIEEEIAEAEKHLEQEKQTWELNSNPTESAKEKFQHIGAIKKNIHQCLVKTGLIHDKKVEVFDRVELIRFGIEKIFNTIKSKHVDEDLIMEDVYKSDDLSALITMKTMEHYIGVLEIKCKQFVRQVAETQLKIQDKKSPSRASRLGRKSDVSIISPKEAANMVP
jgi:hypothetical protein